MKSRGYIDFNCDYWCTFCGHRVHKGQEKHDSLGRPTDWKCGHLLRYKVRNKNQGKTKFYLLKPKETIWKVLTQ